VLSTLPPPPRIFVDRIDERDTVLSRADAARAAGEQGVFVFTGLPGVGKTSLAMWCAKQLRQSGRFEVVLQIGLGASSQAVSVEDALTVFLPHLGVASLPNTRDGLLTAYRVATADRTVLLVLDDVESAAQIEDLLPDSAQSLVIATSRRRSEAFDHRGFTVVPVELFSIDSAKELLAHGMDAGRAAKANEPLRAVAELCGRLPLALGIARAHLAARQLDAVESYLTKLRTAKSTLDEFRIDGERLVETIYEVSYHDLDDDERRLYRLLGLHPGRQFGEHVASALQGPAYAGDPGAELRALTRACLLTEVDAGRFEIHTLVRQHAAGLASEQEHPADCRAALRRTVRSYLEFAVARELVLSNRARFGPLFDGRVKPAHVGDGAWDRAVADLEVERSNLRRVVAVADEEGFDDEAWQLCEALATFYFQRDLFADAIAVHEIGLRCARRVHETAGDARPAARMHAELGIAYFSVQQNEAAREQFDASAALAPALGGDETSVPHLAKMFVWKAFVHQRLDEHAAAVDALAASRELVADPRFPVRLREREDALLDMNGGPMLASVGRYDEAMAAGRRALAYFTSDKERHNHAKSVANLGESLALAGEAHQAEAIDLLTEALRLEDQLSLTTWLAHSSAVLGTLLIRAGQADRGHRLVAQAAELFDQLDDRRAEALRRGIGSG
jgi:tetratricopeptide (TPR) repeat protein